VLKDEHIIYTKAVVSDIEELVDMYTAAVVEMQASGIDQWDEIYPDRDVILEDIHREELTVGKKNGTIVLAYVINTEYDEQYANGAWKYPDSNYCIIHRLCVNPRYQNQGIAKKAILHIEDDSRDKGFDSIRLDSFSRNHFAQMLYEKLNYTVVGYAEWRKGRFELREKKL